jgi:type III secretion protein J
MNTCVEHFPSQPSLISRLLRFISLLLLLCCAVPLLTSCEGKKTIVNSLDEKDANEILVFLFSQGIHAEKVKAEGGGGGGGTALVEWNIVVSDQDAPEAMRLLNQQGLPRRKGQNLLNIFSTSGLVPSDLQEKIKYRAALAEQLASTLRKYGGILDADVQVSFPEEDPLNPGKMKGKITASVWVKHSGILEDPNAHLASKIKQFVSSSVTGLSPDDVTVIGERSRLGDIGIGAGAFTVPEEKSFVNVWSIVLGTESVFRFRVIFFSFTIAILLLLLALIWLLWKTWPTIKAHGGLGSLLTLHSFGATPVVEKKAESEKPAEKKESKEQGLVDRDIDET